MTYLAINTVPLSRDYGFIVSGYDESRIRNEIMNPMIMSGMRKHFIFVKIDKSLADCKADYGGSDEYGSKKASVDMVAIGLSDDSLIDARDVKKEVFLPSDKSKEILLTALDITQVR